MQTYVVNLDSATARWEAMERQLAPLGLPYTRICGVDGRKLSKNDFRHLSNRFRFFLLHARRLQPAELGCALSHRRVYEQMAHDGVSHALILEDDAQIDGDRLQKALAAFKRLDPTRPRIYLLAARYTDRIPAEGLHRIQRFAACATAYLVTAEAAKRIRAANTPIFTLSDNWHVWEEYGVEVFWLTPFAASESGAESQIIWQSPRRANWMWYRVLWQLRHWIGGKIERMLFPRRKI